MDGVIFDLNDCLVQRPDFSSAVRESVNNILKQHYKRTKVPTQFLTDPWLVEHGGNKGWLFNFLLYHAGVLTSTREELVQECRDEYYRLRDLSTVRKFPDAIFLGKIKQKLAIISNSSPETVTEILSSTHLQKYFNSNRIYANGGKSSILADAKADLGKNVIYVGDTPEDICLGRQHGFYTVAISRNIIPTAKLMRARPHLILRSLAALPHLAKHGVKAYGAN